MNFSEKNVCTMKRKKVELKWKESLYNEKKEKGKGIQSVKMWVSP